MELAIGVDFGGTNIKAGIVNLAEGSLQMTRSIPTLAREGEMAVLERIASLVNSLVLESGSGKAEFICLGIGVPGVVDLESGETLLVPNLPGEWKHFPLASLLQQKTGLKVGILNDARAITYGEWKYGNGRGARTMACLAIGTGVGGGLVIERKLHLGIGGEAGELGHLVVDPDGPRCGCGNHGCLEVYASGSAITAMGVKAVLQGQATSIGNMVDFDLNRVSVEVISAAADLGDETAGQILSRAGRYLGIAIANILVSVGPEKVVLAGGVAGAFKHLEKAIRNEIANRVFVMPVRKVELLPALLGSWAGVLGVASWVRENLSG